MTTMDFGCGMGMFSIAMAQLVGRKGRVIAVDLQQEMLDVLQKRATKAGVLDRIRTHRCEPNSIGLDEPVDFALAFYSAHEVPDLRRLLGEVHSNLRPQGRLLVVEIADSSLSFDLGRKAALYATFGVRELWVIDAVKLRARVFRAPAANGYGEARDFAAADQLIPAFAPEAFALRLGELALA